MAFLNNPHILTGRFIRPIALIPAMICLYFAGFAQVMQKIDSLEKSLELGINPQQKLEVFNLLSAEMMNVNIHLAREYSDSAIILGQQMDYPGALGQAYHNAGVERWLNGYYNEAEENYRKAISIFSTLNDSSKLAATYLYLGISYHYHAENDSALYYHFKAISINESLGNMQSVALNLDNIALAYQHMGKFEKVIEYSSSALEIRAGLPGYSSRTNVYNYGGTVFNQKAFEEVVKYHKKILAEELSSGSDLYKIGQSLNNIGSTFYSVRQYDSAIYYLTKSSEAIKQINIPNRFAGQLNELGEALRESGNYPEAERIFLECIHLWDSVGNRTGRAIVRYNLAQNYLMWGKSELSIRYLLAAQAMASPMNYNPFLAKLFYLKSEAYYKLGDLEQALDNALKGLKISKGINIKSSVLSGYMQLSKVYNKIGDHEKAWEYSTKYSLLKDTLYNGESSLQLAQMQVVFETKQKNKEIEVLNVQNASQKAEIKQRNIILALTLAGIFSLTFGFYKRQVYIKRLDVQNEKIENQNLQLSKQNHEKGILLGEIHHRVKNNLQVISSILNLQSRKLADMGAKDAIQEGRNRVKAMALIHQQLYKNDQFANIDIPEYLQTLIHTVGDSFGYEKGSFVLESNIDDIQLDIDNAIKVGLITNELISNAFKHAFGQKRKNILRINCSENEKGLRICISDNGPGVTQEQFENSGNFGIFLVKNLLEDLDGEMHIENNEGTVINLTLKPSV